MSHLSQSVSDAIANATGVGGSPPMHQPSADRVRVEHDGKLFYVVCLSEEEMQRVADAIEVSYGDDPDHMPDSVFNRLKDRFAV